MEQVLLELSFRSTIRLACFVRRSSFSRALQDSTRASEPVFPVHRGCFSSLLVSMSIILCLVTRDVMLNFYWLSSGLRR